MRSLLLPLGLICCMIPHLAWSEDTVTISRARLEELERKASELDRIRSNTQITGENLPAPKPVQEKSVVPPIPIKEGEVMSADELARHYMDAPAEADARYGKKRILIRGEVVGYDKQPFLKDFAILLQTSERGVRVVCNFVSPKDWKAVFPVKSGSELMVTDADGTRSVFSRIGETLVIDGECKGRKDLTIRLGSCRIKQRP